LATKDFSHLFVRERDSIEGLGAETLELEGSYALSKVAKELDLNASLIYKRVREAQEKYTEAEILDMYGIKVTSNQTYLVVMEKFRELYPRLKELFQKVRFQKVDWKKISKDQFFQLEGMYKLKAIVENPHVEIPSRRIYEFIRNCDDRFLPVLGLVKSAKLIGIDLPRGYYLLAGTVNHVGLDEMLQGIKKGLANKEFKKVPEDQLLQNLT